MEKDIKNIIKLWKELNIKHIEFVFSCGGDSMNDTEIKIFDDKGEIDNVELETYFDDEVYKNISFYEASDGHYIGEAGTVFISLDESDEDEPMFSYSKEAEAEYSESIDNDIEIELTDKEKDFIVNYVSNINGSQDGCNFNYKKDFIITNEIQTLIDNLSDKINDATSNYTPEIDFNDNLEDWYNFETSEEIIKENDLIITISNRYITFLPSED